MPEKQIKIKLDERVAYVGKTGSGKTTLARYILQGHTRLICFDPKGTLHRSKDWNLSKPNDLQVARDLRRGAHGRLLLQEVDESRWNYWLDFIWDVRNVALYVDEVYLVVPNAASPSLSFRRLYRQGRELGISVHAATQRPTRIPLEVISEAEWLFTFQLGLKKDRERMAEFGDTNETLKKSIPDQHGFYTYRQGWPNAIYTKKLDLHQKTDAVQIEDRKVPA